MVARESGVRSSAADSVTENGGLDLDDFSIKKMLFYRTKKDAMIVVWQLGLLHRLLQVGLFAYTLFTVFWASQWAQTVDVTNNVNAWVSPGEWGRVSSSSIYCGNASYDYVYSDAWTYRNPVCRRDSIDDVIVKEPSDG